MEHFGLRRRLGVIFLKRVAERLSEKWSKSMKVNRKLTSEKEIGHLLLQNRSHKVWDCHGMVLDPKIPYQISKNIDFPQVFKVLGPGTSKNIDLIFVQI